MRKQTKRRIAGWTRPLIAAGLLVPLVAVAAAAAGAPRPGWAVGESKRPVDFNRDVLPILSENCFACHGTDRTSAGRPAPGHARGAKPLPSGKVAVVPGNLEAERAVPADPRKTAVMPPAASGKKLDAAADRDAAPLDRAGRPVAPHWALHPAEAAGLPAVEDAAWRLNPIDRFILARLERAGHRALPEARTVHARSAGVQPRPARPAADAGGGRCVRRRQPARRLREGWSTACSPRRTTASGWRRYWLDLARYADTDGYHSDNDRDVWPYRDWVIRAFNHNKPFDRFTVEQLAGDLLPDADAASRRSPPAYNRLLHDHRRGRRAATRSTRPSTPRTACGTPSTVWLGLTVGCARVPRPQVRPDPQKDFYRFAAFFADVKEKGFYDDGFGRATGGRASSCPTAAQKAEWTKLDAQVEAAKQAIGCRLRRRARRRHRRSGKRSQDAGTLRRSSPGRRSRRQRRSRRAGSHDDDRAGRRGVRRPASCRSGTPTPSPSRRRWRGSRRSGSGARRRAAARQQGRPRGTATSS